MRLRNYTILKYLLALPGLIGLLGTACSSSRFVKPLNAKQRAIQADMGGPLIRFAGAAIPIPFSTLAYGYGVTGNVSAYGSLHTTSLLFGNLQHDIGICANLWKAPKNWAISTSPALQIAYNLRNQTGFRIWPSLDLNLRYEQNNGKGFWYAGVMSWSELSAKKAHGQVQQRHAMPNLHLGYTVTRTLNRHQFELKYLGVGVPSKPGVVDYIGIRQKGSFGIYYTLTRTF